MRPPLFDLTPAAVLVPVGCVVAPSWSSIVENEALVSLAAAAAGRLDDVLVLDDDVDDDDEVEEDEEELLLLEVAALSSSELAILVSR